MGKQQLRGRYQQHQWENNNYAEDTNAENNGEVLA
jgi:hypothetical protein